MLKFVRKSYEPVTGDANRMFASAYLSRDEELRRAYAQGRADTLYALGIDEKDLPQADGPHGWAG